MGELMDVILHRRSVRRFNERQVDEEALRQILEAGLYAPSAGGRQSVLFAVCQDGEINRRLGRIKRANSRPQMASGENYVSREQPSIADDPKLTNAFYDAPTVITLFCAEEFFVLCGGRSRQSAGEKGAGNGLRLQGGRYHGCRNMFAETAVCRCSGFCHGG